MSQPRSAFVLAATLATTPWAARADVRTDAAAYPAVTNVPRCDDASDVVGYRKCSPYGGWAGNLRVPYMTLDFGINLRHFAATPAPAVALRTTSPMASVRRSSEEALTFDDRIGVGLRHGLYLALDLELGNFADFDSKLPAARDVLVDGLGVVGFRARIAPLAVAVELAGGAMGYSYPVDSAFHTVAVVEARGRAEVWLSPWITLGGTIGASLLRQGEWMAGIDLGFHSYTYAGDR